MEQVDISTIVIIGLAAIALIVFLIWKNQKDKKTLNPDASDITEETRMDQDRSEDRS